MVAALSALHGMVRAAQGMEAQVWQEHRRARRATKGQGRQAHGQRRFVTLVISTAFRARHALLHRDLTHASM